MTVEAGVLEAAACRRHPAEWWVGVGRGRREAEYGIAVHICLSHCPVRFACERDVRERPAWVAGVFAGVLYVGDGRPSQKQPKPRTVGCPECMTPVVAVAVERNAAGYIEARLPLVRSMRRRGMSYTEIATALDCSRTGVSAVCKRFGIKAGARPKARGSA